MTFCTFNMSIFLLLCTSASSTSANGVCGKQCCKHFIQVWNKCIECPDGKTGENCWKNCEVDFYGKNCEEVCNCTSGQVCSSVYGCVPKPLHGCPPGKHGKECLQNCEPDRYETNCTEICSCDHGQYCHPEKGCRNLTIPDDSGCQPGKQEKECFQNCEPDTRYGTNCTETCSCGHGQYCHPEKGCRNLKVPDDADSFNFSQNLFEQRWFRITVISFLGSIIIVVIAAIMPQKLKKTRAGIGSRERETIGQDYSTSNPQRNDLREQNDNYPYTQINDENASSSLREPSFIEQNLNIGSTKQKKTSTFNMITSKKDRQVSGRDAAKEVFHETNVSVSGENGSIGDTDDIYLNENGYHQVHRNYSFKSAKKLPN